MTGTFSVPLVSDCLLSGGKGIQIVLVTTASSLTAIFMDWVFFISLLHTGYTEGLQARYAACNATRRDKEQTNIWVAPRNPDQSVCLEPDKLTGRRGHKRWKEWVMAAGMEDSQGWRVFSLSGC